MLIGQTIVRRATLWCIYFEEWLVSDEWIRAHTLPSGARLVDGGIWANNPLGLAVVEAIGVLGWHPRSRPSCWRGRILTNR